MSGQFDFQTIADRIGVMTDQSVLFFRIDFSAVPLPVLTEAAIEYCRFVEEFYQEKFISLWEFYKNGKLFTPERDKLFNKIKDSPTSPDFTLGSFVRTEFMNARKHMNALYRRLVYDMELPCPKVSTDFEPYFQEKIVPVLKDDDALKQAVIHLFQERGKKPMAPSRMNDSAGLFYSAPEDLGSTLYYGKIEFDISVVCLNDDLCRAADIFSNELKKLCMLLVNAGGGVGIVPFIIANQSPYLHYFYRADDRNLDYDFPEGCRAKNWNTISFLCDCEWGNVLSPIAKKRIASEELRTASDRGLVVEELDNHGIYVQVNKNVAYTDMDDLQIMKRFLYPALYPGKISRTFMISDGSVLLNLFPRCWWERVPIFPEEIHVQNSTIYFEHKV